MEGNSCRRVAKFYKEQRWCHTTGPCFDKSSLSLVCRRFYDACPAAAAVVVVVVVVLVPTKAAENARTVLRAPMKNNSRTRWWASGRRSGSSTLRRCQVCECAPRPGGCPDPARPPAIGRKEKGWVGSAREASTSCRLTGRQRERERESDSSLPADGLSL